MKTTNTDHLLKLAIKNIEATIPEYEILKTRNRENTHIHFIGFKNVSIYKIDPKKVPIIPDSDITYDGYRVAIKDQQISIFIGAFNCSFPVRYLPEIKKRLKLK